MPVPLLLPPTPRLHMSSYPTPRPRCCCFLDFCLQVHALGLLRFILTNLSHNGVVVTLQQAIDVEARCLEALDWRLGPFFVEDELAGQCAVGVCYVRVMAYVCCFEGVWAASRAADSARQWRHMTAVSHFRVRRRVCCCCFSAAPAYACCRHHKSTHINANNNIIVSDATNPRSTHADEDLELWAAAMGHWDYGTTADSALMGF